MDRDPADFKNKNNENDVKTLVEDISTGASNLAQSMCTREKTRQKIFNESRNVKIAVDDLFTEYDRYVCSVYLYDNKETFFMFIYLNEVSTNVSIFYFYRPKEKKLLVSKLLKIRSKRKLEI